MPAIPITLVTGFLGSGKTTLLLSLIPQLRALNPTYKLALLKNEFGDLAIDSQLASQLSAPVPGNAEAAASNAEGGASAISSVRELLNGCICCNLVGQLAPALQELRESVQPNRIVIETSGSAFPATLAMEVNRLGRETGDYVLDGVVTVIDCENWKGYEDTSYTARLQARYTDLVVLNKWEEVGERRVDEVLDRLGDLEVQVAIVKSERGRVPVDVVFGIDGGLARGLGTEAGDHAHEHEHDHKHENGESHQSEVEVLSVTLRGEGNDMVDTTKLEKLLKQAPKDEVYRIKAVLAASKPIPQSDDSLVAEPSTASRYILNWAFARWTCTPVQNSEEHASSKGIALRMTMILARYESTKWKKKLEEGGFIELEGGQKGTLSVEKIV